MSNSTLIPRERPHAERHEAVLEAFESAEPGKAPAVINDHDPSPFLHERDAKFEAFDAESTSKMQSAADRFEARPKKKSDASGARGEDFEATILDALRGVTDPYLGLDIVDAGVITASRREAGRVIRPRKTRNRFTVDTAGRYVKR